MLTISLSVPELRELIAAAPASTSPAPEAPSVAGLVDYVQRLIASGLTDTEKTAVVRYMEGVVTSAHEAAEARAAAAISDEADRRDYSGRQPEPSEPDDPDASPSDEPITTAGPAEQKE